MKKIFLIIAVVSGTAFSSGMTSQSELSKRICIVTEYISKMQTKINADEDALLVDSIYSYALEVCAGDIQETLVTLIFSVIPYNKVPLRSPMLKFPLIVPLYSADEAVYELKNKKLPRRLFFDSPNNEFADSDKLAHFFGSALLSYSLRNDYFCTYIGYLVEIFEDAFKIEGAADTRDVTANSLGNAFGSNLRSKTVKPSSVFVSFNLQYMVR